MNNREQLLKDLNIFPKKFIAISNVYPEPDNRITSGTVCLLKSKTLRDNHLYYEADKNRYGYNLPNFWISLDMLYYWLSEGRIKIIK